MNVIEINVKLQLQNLVNLVQLNIHIVFKVYLVMKENVCIRVRLLFYVNGLQFEYLILILILKEVFVESHIFVLVKEMVRLLVFMGN